MEDLKYHFFLKDKCSQFPVDSVVLQFQFIQKFLFLALFAL